MKKLIIASLAILALSGCKDSTISQFEALGSKHKISLYGATGTLIQSWESTGNVSNEAQSDGWYFKDAATDKLVEVTGTLIIEQE